MPFFGDNQDDADKKGADEGEGDEKDRKFTFGEKEYTKDELEKIFEKQKIVEDLEKDHGDISKLKSEFGRRADEIGKLKEQLTELEKKEEDPETPDLSEDEEEAKKQLEAGIKQIKEHGHFLTQDEVRQVIRQERMAEQLLDQVKGLSEEINGEDGRPKFEGNDILQYMKETGINNPERAYKIKHEEELEKWKADQLAKGTPSGMPTNTETPSTKYPEIKIPKNEGGLKKAVSEFLDQLEAGR